MTGKPGPLRVAAVFVLLAVAGGAAGNMVHAFAEMQDGVRAAEDMVQTLRGYDGGDPGRVYRQYAATVKEAAEAQVAPSEMFVSAVTATVAMLLALIYWPEPRGGRR